MTIDKRIEYGPPGQAGICRLRIYQRPDCIVCLLTELVGNRGLTVTNGIEQACRVAAEAIAPVRAGQRIVFVEHWPAQRDWRAETFDEVRWKRPERFDGPDWVSMTREQFETLIGERMAPERWDQ